jgi:hypothetical protein
MAVGVAGAAVMYGGEQTAQAAGTTILTVTTSKLNYAPGGTVTFTGTLKTSTGLPVPNVRIGIDDSLKEVCTLGPTTSVIGAFTYTVTAPSTAKGNYGFTFYGGTKPVYVVVTVVPLASSGTLLLSNSAGRLPLGVSTAVSSFNAALTRKFVSTYGMPKATQAQLQSALTEIESYVVGSVSGSVKAFVSNPANDVVLLGAVGCTVGTIWTGVGVASCTPLYIMVGKAAAKSTFVGTAKTIIDKSSMTGSNKTLWKQRVDATNCVVGVFMLDAKSAAVSTFGSGWTCGSAVASVVTDSASKPALKMVALPPATAANQTAIGFVVLQK